MQTKCSNKLIECVMCTQLKLLAICFRFTKCKYGHRTLCTVKAHFTWTFAQLKRFRCKKMWVLFVCLFNFSTFPLVNVCANDTLSFAKTNLILACKTRAKRVTPTTLGHLKASWTKSKRVPGVSYQIHNQIVRRIQFTNWQNCSISILSPG